MKAIGLTPSQDFDPSKLGAFDREVIKTIPKLAQAKIMEDFKKAAVPVNGWTYMTKNIGVYGTDYVQRALVCDARKNALLKEGNKSDRIDARKLAELLRTNQLNPVYHGEHGVRTLKELGRNYLTITKDVTRVMNRTKALYEAGPSPATAAAYMLHVIAPSGWPRSWNQEFGFEPNGCTSNSIVCNRCVSKPDANSCWRATGTLQ